jgi:hypothetical protein
MRHAILFAAVLGLAACAPEQPKDYETDTVDKSGGELIVEEENPEAVDVKLPETAMTNAPETPEPSATPEAK